jgi:hypothetical protein
MALTRPLSHAGGYLFSEVKRTRCERSRHRRVWAIAESAGWSNPVRRQSTASPNPVMLRQSLRAGAQRAGGNARQCRLSAGVLAGGRR